MAANIRCWCTLQAFIVNQLTRPWNTRCSFSQIEMKESRNASSLLSIKLVLMISDLDLVAIVSGHVCADRSDVELWKGYSG